jgi:hypothetical protein
VKITIETIAHEQQRYPTCGDWTFDAAGNLTIKVSQLSDPRFEALIAIHELTEAVMCQHAGVTQEMVDLFDKAFERDRHPDNDDEPGDHPDAPYRRQHGIASGIESILAAEMGVVWGQYEKEVNALP